MGINVQQTETDKEQSNIHAGRAVAGCGWAASGMRSGRIRERAESAGGVWTCVVARHTPMTLNATGPQLGRFKIENETLRRAALGERGPDLQEVSVPRTRLGCPPRNEDGPPVGSEPPRSALGATPLHGGLEFLPDRQDLLRLLRRYDASFSGDLRHLRDSVVSAGLNTADSPLLGMTFSHPLRGGDGRIFHSRWPRRVSVASWTPLFWALVASQTLNTGREGRLVRLAEGEDFVIDVVREDDLVAGQFPGGDGFSGRGGERTGFHDSSPEPPHAHLAVGVVVCPPLHTCIDLWGNNFDLITPSLSLLLDPLTLPLDSLVAVEVVDVHAIRI